ncbi:MAG: type I-C CRISPR-associated protein Cas8c/Csd1, partial [Caldisericia bacterium]|nr:type I-C CRISPR-associated protein Cas8c/Csd1 [Caldisericia bacterium]
SENDIEAVRKFFQKGKESSDHFIPALEHTEYGDILSEGNVKVSFQVIPSKYKMVFQNPTVKEALQKTMIPPQDRNIARCLITGEKDHIETTHPVIKGVKDTIASGACIVSFNDSAFESYYKKQSFNAPISKKAASRYTKALNLLLSSSKQCIHIADMSMVFWAKKEPTPLEEYFSSFFEEPDKESPDNNTQKIKAVVESIHNGSFIKLEKDQNFYILGLAPNKARISIRFWFSTTINQLVENITQFFDDFSILKPSFESEYYSVYTILVNIATQHDKKKIPPNLAGEFVKAILTNTPYPASLFQLALNRIRSDTERKPMNDKNKLTTTARFRTDRVKPVRAALLKAYINRYYRFYPSSNHKEIKMKLDKTQPSVGYQLGRLFATLVKIQNETNASINAPIQDRFYGSACASPVTVFPILLKLKNHHIAKLPNRKVYFEQLIGEIISNINDFPNHLNLHDQGRFSIGYYHQMQDFYTKKEDKSENL